MTIHTARKIKDDGCKVEREDVFFQNLSIHCTLFLSLFLGFWVYPGYTVEADWGTPPQFRVQGNSIIMCGPKRESQALSAGGDGQWP